MAYAASLSTAAETSQALDAVCRQVRAGLQGETPHLALLFLSHHHQPGFESAAQRVREALHCEVLIGCAGESIAGEGEEIEEQPAVALWAAVLPGVELRPFRLHFRNTADGLVCDGFPDLDDLNSTDVRAVLLLGDPYSSSVDFVIEQLADALPGTPLLGGMASGGRNRGQNCLFYQSETADHGAVGVIIRGGPPLISVVSQGCRQIGKTFVVTKAERNVILELGGAPALTRLKEIWQDLSREDQILARQGLQVGIVMNEYQENFRSGDFLVANVLGADQETGAIALGNYVRTGQTIQFHVRDASTADEELRHLLERETAGKNIGGALLFSCNGRGTRLFPAPHHDTGVIREICGPIPLAGFFAQGELGPVAGKNYIHGYTASVVLFEE